MAAVINLKVKSDFAAASADLKKFGTITESQRIKIEKFQAEFKDESINKFIDRANRATAAIKATRGPLDALTAEHKQYQRQIETLIRRGLDPQSKEIKTLTKRYKKLEAEIKDVTKAQAKQQKKSKLMKGALIGLGASAVLMGKQLVTAMIEFGKASAQAASDAEEIEGKFNVVFRSIAEEGETAAISLAEDFDLASSTAQELLGDTGDLLTGFGLTAKSALELSEETNRLAIDLASFTNAQGGAAAVSAALTKSYAGERESLKTYGIVISEADVQARLLEDAQKGLTFENERAAKAYATLSIATEQSRNAIGDYERTSDSAANVNRRLEESQKSLKEAWGVAINQGLTPLRSALANITTAWADLLSKQNQARAFMDDFRDGSIDTELSLVELEQTLEGLEKKRGQAGAGRFVEEEIRAVKALISAYGIQDTFLIQATDQARILAQVDIDAAEAKAAQIKLEEAALEKLEALRVASLSTAEKEIVSLQEQIDEWAGVRTNMEDTATVQKILNELVEQRNELQNEVDIVPDLEEQNKHYRTQVELEGILLGVEEERRDLLAAGASLKAAKLEEEAEALKEVEEEYKSIAKTISGFVSGPLNDLGKALVTGQAGWKDLAKSAIGSLAGVIKALGEQAVVQAAIAAASLNIPAAIAFGLAATGAFIAAGAVEAGANTFQTGTGQPFTVPESAASSRADSRNFAVGPGEEVSVTPRGESGRMQRITTIIGEQVLFDVINEGIESGDIRITAENIQGGAAVA